MQRETTLVCRCDGIQHCESNKDEEDCPYEQLGCEAGWMPYNENCFKMEGMVSFSWTPGKTLIQNYYCSIPLLS